MLPFLVRHLKAKADSQSSEHGVTLSKGRVTLSSGLIAFEIRRWSFYDPASYAVRNEPFDLFKSPACGRLSDGIRRGESDGSPGQVDAAQKLKDFARR